MIQQSSYLKVLEVFFQEPTKIHFIREIGKKIGLAQTSARIHIKKLLEEGLIIKKKAHPFDGFVANRDSEKFIHFKQSYNLYSIFEIKKRIVEEIYPKCLILFGSYNCGEDIETSDIDFLVISKVKKNIDVSDLEKKLKRKINILFIKDVNVLDFNLKENLKKGLVLYGR